MRISASLWLVAVPFVLAGQALPSPLASTHPRVDSERLLRIHQVLESALSDSVMVGAVALVTLDGKPIFHRAYGIDDRDKGSRLRADAIFRIASQTKAITSVGILMMMEAGKISLNDPVERYIPSFQNAQVLDRFHDADTTYTTLPAKRPITLRDLLTHTSGLGYADIGSPAMRAIYAKNGITGGVGERRNKMPETMHRLGQLPLEYQPGERWNYGLNTDVLGYILEKVSGMSLEEFFRKNICGPLGMKDTWFNLPASSASRLSRIYRRDSLRHFSLLTEKESPISPDYPIQEKTYFSGGSGLVSTATDYAAFLQMILGGGSLNGVRLLSPRTVGMMLANHIGNKLGEAYFGLGFGGVSPAQTGDIRHPGTFYWGGAFATTYWADPRENLVAILMTQQLGAGPEWGRLQEQFAMAIYQALH